MLDFVFLEYGFDPEIQDSEEVFSKLGKLGFILRSEHVEKKTTFWNQNQCIIMIQERPGTGIPSGITGLGFMGLDNHIIDTLGALPESISNTYTCSDTGYLRTVIIPAEITANLGGIIKYSMVSREFESSYVTIDHAHYSNPGLTYVSGVVYKSTEKSVQDHYKALGFRHTKTSGNFQQLLSNSDRFSIFLDEQTRANPNTVVVCDTDDVFWTTACYSANNMNLSEFKLENADVFGDLQHKIVGYNCHAEGKRTSYCIAQVIPDALPGLDLVFMTRRQFTGVPDGILEIACAK